MLFQNGRRWFFSFTLVCVVRIGLYIKWVLLAATANVQSYHRPKRDLSSIKNFITSKLFGRETIIIQMPDIPKNETHTFLKIKGYDNIILKVTRKPEKNNEKIKIVEEKVQDPIIVRPELAIMGSYLGTTTQSETILALDIAKTLVKAGILNSKQDTTLQEFVIPVTPDTIYNNLIAQVNLQPEKVLIEEKYPIYAYPAIVTNPEKHDIVTPVPYYSSHYPPTVTSEQKYIPFQSKFSYTHKGENADTKYESNNNQGVIVNKTNKVPPILPQIKLKLAEVSSIGANPQPQQQPVELITEEHLEPINAFPGFYGVPYPSDATQQVISNPYVMGYTVPSIPTSIYETPISTAPLIVPNYIKHSKQAVDYRNYLIKAELDQIMKFYQNSNFIKNNGSVVPQLAFLNKNMSTVKCSTKNNKTKVFVEEKQNINIKNYTNDQTATKYFYKQINHNNPNKYMVYKVDDSSAPKYANPQTNDAVPEDFIYVPPENIDIPLPSKIPKSKSNKDKENISNAEITSETKNYPTSIIFNKSMDNTLQPLPIETVNMGKQKPLKNNPIDEESKQNPNRNYKDIHPYTGGPVF